MGGAHPRERMGLNAQYATLEQAQIMQQEACNRPAVLVVEDEILLRWTAASLIDETGFNASEAGSAVEAISMLNGETTCGLLSPTSRCLAQLTVLNSPI